MWIPYDIRASLKAETDPATVRMSRADTSERDFLVGFFLRNPVTQAWELDIAASAAGQELAALATPPGMRISLHGNDAGKLSEVIYRLAAGSAQEALARAHDDFQRRLLRWMAEIGRGMAIAGWRIADTAHSARWRCTPFRPSAMNLDFDRLAPLAADLAPFVELFQRTRNAPDAASRLLAAYALIHSVQTRHPALAHALGDDFRLTQEMLIHAGAMDYSETLVGQPLEVLAGLLQPLQQRLTTPEGLLAAIHDDLAAQQKLAQLANLADLVSHRLIQAELRHRASQPNLPSAVAATADGTPAHSSGVQPC